MDISEAALNHALITELCSGRKFMEAKQELRERDCAREALAARGHKSIPQLGKLAAVIPQHEYFIMRERYGEECWHDREFVRDFQKTQSHLAVHKI